MSDTAWLKQVLADAKAAKREWPDWAKDRSVETELNSHPEEISESCSNTSKSQAADGNGSEGIKLI